MKGCLENALRVPWGVRGKNEAKPCFSIFWRKNKKKIFCFFPLASDVTVRFDAAQTLKSRLKGKTEPNRQNFFEIWSEGDLALSRQKNRCFQTFLTNQQSFWTENSAVRFCSPKYCFLLFSADQKAVFCPQILLPARVILLQILLEKNNLLKGKKKRKEVRKEKKKGKENRRKRHHTTSPGLTPNPGNQKKKETLRLLRQSSVFIFLFLFFFI